MYSKTVTAAAVARLSASRGKDLIYYNYDYIRACVDHIEQLTLRDSKGRPEGFSRPLALDELDFISNERLLCGLDYLHWAENYHYIRHAETLAMIPFRQNSYQRALTLAQAEMEEVGKPNITQLLKARQGGGTTDTTSKIQHRIQFVPNSASVIASSDPDKSWKLSEMITRSLVLQPHWLLPDGLKVFQSGETFIECDPKNSYISIQHGAQGTGIVRGDTVKAFHLSEIPDYINPGLIIDASLFGAWHPTPLHFGVLESTAKGRKNYWHKLWLKNKERWPLQLSLQRPLFLPYYVSSEIYPTEGWLASIPIPNGYEPSLFVRDHAQRAKEYVRSDPFLSRVLGSDWQMSLATQWWYQFSYEEAEREDKLADFLSEYCSTDTEAFQSRSKSVFSIQLIQSYEVKIPQPVGVFKLTGSELPKHLAAESAQILDTDKRIIIPHSTNQEDLSWTLTPIKFPGYSSVNSHLDTLWVWEYPQENADYCIAMDGAQGIDRDRTVVPVIRKGTYDRPAGQVACFSSSKIGSLEVWPICLMLLNYYSTWSNFKRDMNRPLFSPEVRVDGASCLLEVRKRGWSRIYFRRDRAARKQDSDRVTKLGWDTTPGDSGSRALLISWLITTIKGHYIEINSPWTIDEMRDFVAVENEATHHIRIEHDKGAHDDELFGLGIGTVTLHELDIYRGQTPQWRAAQQEIENLVKFATYRDGYPETRHDVKDIDRKHERKKGVMYPIKSGELTK